GQCTEKGFLKLKPKLDYFFVPVAIGFKARRQKLVIFGVKGTMWNEARTSNWVGHLITQYAPEPRYNPNRAAVQDAYREKPLLVYDYAVGGDTMSGVQFQIDSCFLAGDFKRLERDNSWDPDHALFGALQLTVTKLICAAYPPVSSR
ncbi:hypothetical protein MPER_08510, partial [Moniliophthora perniciosa FA553]